HRRRGSRGPTGALTRHARSADRLPRRRHCRRPGRNGRGPDPADSRRGGLEHAAPAPGPRRGGRPGPTGGRVGKAMRFAMRGLVASVLALTAAAALTGTASAHPLGNYTVNRAVVVRVGAATVDVRYVVDMAEIPTFT